MKSLNVSLEVQIRFGSLSKNDQELYGIAITNGKDILWLVRDYDKVLYVRKIDPKTYKAGKPIRVEELITKGSFNGRDISFKDSIYYVVAGNGNLTSQNINFVSKTLRG
jgi:hypothetical protein